MDGERALYKLKLTGDIVLAGCAVLNESKTKLSNSNYDWMDLGECHQALKLLYSLYPGYTYDLDILIWQNAAKVWCGNKYCWVRVWSFLDKYWLAFTIRHSIPVKIEQFINHEVVITPVTGFLALNNSTKSDKNFFIRIPPIKFAETPYLSKIEEKGEHFIDSIIEVLWSNVVKVIPHSHMDGFFDAPSRVTDIRHQDAIMGCIKKKCSLMNTTFVKKESTTSGINTLTKKDKAKNKSGMEGESVLFKLKLTGDIILAGSGRVNSFEEFGQCLPNQGHVLAVISSSNLPSHHDLPIVVIHVNKLAGIHAQEFLKAGFSHLYTRFNIGSEEYNLPAKKLTSLTEIHLKHHQVIPIEKHTAREIFNVLRDNCFKIQLRGIKKEKRNVNSPKLYKNDCQCKFKEVKSHIEEDDVIIASTKINVEQLFKQSNRRVSGAFSLFKPHASFLNLRKDCTNNINAIRNKMCRNIGFSLPAETMTDILLHVSIGIIGCDFQMNSMNYSRLYCLCVKQRKIESILKYILNINKRASMQSNKHCVLTGFSLDIGDCNLIYVEGQRNQNIVKVWELAETFNSDIKSIFSTADSYLERIYPEFPFELLKIRIPLSNLLACPSVYVRPALPLPAKNAMLKISQILAGKMFKSPLRCEMPTMEELLSFKLELCVP